MSTQTLSTDLVHRQILARAASCVSETKATTWFHATFESVQLEKALDWEASHPPDPDLSQLLFNLVSQPQHARLKKCWTGRDATGSHPGFVGAACARACGAHLREKQLLLAFDTICTCLPDFSTFKKNTSSLAGTAIFEISRALLLAPWHTGLPDLIFHRDTLSGPWIALLGRDVAHLGAQQAGTLAGLLRDRATEVPDLNFMHYLLMSGAQLDTFASVVSAEPRFFMKAGVPYPRAHTLLAQSVGTLVSEGRLGGSSFHDSWVKILGSAFDPALALAHRKDMGMGFGHKPVWALCEKELLNKTLLASAFEPCTAHRHNPRL